jgi:hypothetical protein
MSIIPSINLYKEWQALLLDKWLYLPGLHKMGLFRIDFLALWLLFLRLTTAAAQFQPKMVFVSNISSKDMIPAH